MVRSKFRQSRRCRPSLHQMEPNEVKSFLLLKQPSNHFDQILPEDTLTREEQQVLTKSDEPTPVLLFTLIPNLPRFTAFRVTLM